MGVKKEARHSFFHSFIDLQALRSHNVPGTDLAAVATVSNKTVSKLPCVCIPLNACATTLTFSVMATEGGPEGDN